jgi:hypothetical protein
MAVMIDGVARPRVRSRRQQAWIDAGPILRCVGICVFAVSVPVLLRLLAFFPE